MRPPLRPQAQTPDETSRSLNIFVSFVMKMPISRDQLACALWVAALSLMVFGSLDTERLGRCSAFLAWGVFVAVVACVPTGLCILAREREKDETSVERIVEVVDALHEGRREVSRLR
jgi:hypothetical protein